MWPAHWLLSEYLCWPVGTEFDILETIGDGKNLYHQTNIIYCTTFLVQKDMEQYTFPQSVTWEPPMDQYTTPPSITVMRTTHTPLNGMLLLLFGMKINKENIFILPNGLFQVCR